MYIKRKLVWYSGNTIYEITSGIISMTSSKTTDTTNNKIDVILSDYDIMYSGDTFLPQEGDLMFCYSKCVINNSNTEFTDDDIVWTGKFIDESHELSPDNNTLTLTIGDYSYDVNNQFHNKSYYGLGMKTNEVIIDIVRNKVENSNGDGNYKLDFTNVASLRNNGSAFPVIEPAFTGKPTHEWLSEISSPTWTNSDAEYSGTQIISEDMVFDIRGTHVYWYEPSSTSTHTIDENTYIISLKEKTNNESSVNFVIFECGEDFNGNKIFWYAVDENSGGKIQKEKYETQLKLAGVNSDWENTYNVLRKQYSISTNSAFVIAVKKKADCYSQEFFNKQNRNTLSITIDRDNTYNIGDRVTVNLPKVCNAQYYVRTINHRDTDNEQSTTLELQKTQK